MEEIKSLETQISELKNQVSNNLPENIKVEIDIKINELISYLNTFYSNHTKYLSKFEKGDVSLTSENSLSIYEQYKDTFAATFSKVDKKANEIKDLMDNSTKN
jgi:hypothetical protein